MNQTSIELLTALTQADAIPRPRGGGQTNFPFTLGRGWRYPKGSIGKHLCTKIGNAANPRVLLDSHMDEVGFIVQSVTGAGYVKFLTVGGWWAHTLLAQRVNILTKQGKVSGVIGSTPPHLLSAGSRDKVMDIKDLYIDIGAESAEQAMEEYGVKPGCPIVPYGPFMPMRNPKLFSAKAFDNRVGVGLVIETLQQLGDHPNTVIGTGSVQEEIGPARCANSCYCGGSGCGNCVRRTARRRFARG